MDRATRFYRRKLQVLCASALVGSIGLAGFAGCSSWINRKEKDNHFVKETKRIKELMVDPDRPRLIGEVANSTGMSSRSYDSYAIAASLPGTGGIVRPGAQRDWMLDEMKIRDTENPEAFLDDPSTALVKLRTIASPCNAKGEILDVQVEVSTECTATDLTEGFILESRLSEIAAIKGQLRTGNIMAIASGEVVVLPTCFTRKNELTPLQGVVVGGAKLKQEKPIGLQIESEFRHVIVTKAIEKAINERFFYKDSNKQKLVAEGTSDWYVALSAIPKYRNDPAHFMSIIKCTGFGETSDEQEERLLGCRKLLADPATCRRAAAELEAIGSDAAKQVLLSGLSSTDLQVRFYSAYSLAYLDNKESVPVLTELAHSTPAARALCLVGLVVNEDSSAREALEQLLQDPEPDLRFGAFNAIRTRNPNDMSVKGETIGKNFLFVQVPSSTPLLAVSLQKQKEVILFGNSIGISLFAPLAPTQLLTLTPVAGDQIKMSKRQSNGETHHVVVASDLVSLLQGFGMLRANYNDVVHSLDKLSMIQALATPVAMHPLPNQEAKTAESEKEIQVDNASAKYTESRKSNWWTPAGLLRTTWIRPKRGATKSEADSTETTSSTTPATTTSTTSDMTRDESATR